jgi:membrane protease subunit HflK
MPSNYESIRQKEEKTLSILINAVGIFVLALFLIFNAVYTLSETEQAVVTTFGVPTVNTGKGIQFKIPFIQKVKKVDTTIKGFELGYRTDEKGNYHTVEDESLMITSDANFIDVDFYITYKISDAEKYLYKSTSPERILKDIAQTCIRDTISAYSVDAVLTTGKSEIQSNITDMIIKELEALDIGITLSEVSIQDAEPPTQEIRNAFKAVETAKQDKESAINNANKYRNEQLPAAEATANKKIQQAEATKQYRINEATGEVSYYNKMYEEYLKYPLITKQRMFYEAMEELLPKLKVIIDDGNGNLTNVLVGETNKGGN